MFYENLTTNFNVWLEYKVIKDFWAEMYNKYNQSIMCDGKCDINYSITAKFCFI